MKELGKDVEAVLLLQRERLTAGHRQYGELKISNRGQAKNLQDALEEALDLSQYLTMELLRLQRESHWPERKQDVILRAFDVAAAYIDTHKSGDIRPQLDALLKAVEKLVK